MSAPFGHTIVPSSESRRTRRERLLFRSGSEMGPASSLVRSTTRRVPSVKGQPQAVALAHLDVGHAHHAHILREWLDGLKGSRLINSQLPVGGQLDAMQCGPFGDELQCRYADQEAKIDISTFEVVDGTHPLRVWPDNRANL